MQSELAVHAQIKRRLLRPCHGRQAMRVVAVGMVIVDCGGGAGSSSSSSAVHLAEETVAGLKARIVARGFLRDEW